MEEQEYYNVDILYLKFDLLKENNSLQGEHLIAFTKDEIIKYINLIKQGKFGKQPLGNKKVNVVDPEQIRIFDYSKTIFTNDSKRPDYIKKTEEKIKYTNDYLQAFEDLGKDVTDSFRIQLEEILGITTTTVTTPESTSSEIEELKENNDKKELKPESGSVEIEGKEPKISIQLKPIFPNEFNEGILDSTVDPAFKVEKIASVFAYHLKNLKHENGQMIGVFGQWGRGKSYFVKEVYKQLERVSDQGAPFLNIKFQAWKYQSTPSIWAYLFETFIKEYLEVGWWDRIWRIIHLSVKRSGKWKTWGKSVTVIIFGILWFLLIPYILRFIPVFSSNENSESIIKWLGSAGAASFIIVKINSFIKFSKKPAIYLFNSLSKIPSFKQVLGIQEEIHKELVSLINAWNKYLKGKRLLLFIDDLDRCSHHSLIEIVDSLRVMLDDEEINRHVLVLMALDEDKLQRVIHTKYENLYKKDNELETIAIEYLDKLFISAIKLYPITDDERAEYINKIANQINSDASDNSPSEEKNPRKAGSKTESKNKKEDFKKSEESEVTEKQENEDISSANIAENESKEKIITLQNLNDSEINTLAEKIKKTNKELTPRQIRIVVYRYLLARNLWLAMAKELEFKTDDVLDEILKLSGYSKENRNTTTKLNYHLFSIVRMVIAY